MCAKLFKVRNNNQKRKILILWPLLIFTILVVLTDSFIEAFGYKPLPIISFLKILMPIAVGLLHISIVFTSTRGLLFILLSSLTGLFFEVAGVKYGVVFGGHYEYNNQYFGLTLFNIPLLVPIYWTVFIYIGYSLVTSFLVWINKNKPTISNDGWALLPILVIFDGLVVTAIDIFMDPLMVYQKRWFWREGGPFFNIPIGNFVGWFAVTAIATGMFRIFEYLFPQRPRQFDKSIYLVTTFSYAALCVSLFVSAIGIRLPQLALLGVFVMMPTVIINLLYFKNWRG